MNSADVAAPVCIEAAVTPIRSAQEVRGGNRPGTLSTHIEGGRHRRVHITWWGTRPLSMHLKRKTPQP